MPTQATHAVRLLGQSLWLDNITRDLLDSGTLQRYIDTLWITGLTSNPTIFEKAIARSTAYDAEIAQHRDAAETDETVFFALAIADLRRAADLFAPVHDRTGGVDGFVSLEVSPDLAYDTDATIAQAKALCAKAARDNLFIKIPGTPEGLPAISACIAAGIAVNVTLLFSVPQYLAAADAWMSGLELRAKQGLSCDVPSVASLFVSRWDVAAAKLTPASLHNTLGIAVSHLAYRAYRDLMDSDRFQRLQAHGARPQRLLFASTGTKDPAAPDTLYIEALTAPNTVNTMPEDTLLALDDHGAVPPVLSRDSDAADAVLARHVAAGIDVDALGARLQMEGASAFVASWRSLLACVAVKRR